MSYLFTIIHIPVLQGLVPLDFSRYSERRHKIEKCSSPFILSLLWVMRVKAKTWGVIGKIHFLLFFLTSKIKLPKSQLQTVLITASGPQAFNALVHRKRYTQGSRQNRCVSSQDALALRARVSGTGEARSLITQPSFSAVRLSGFLTLTYDCSWWTSPTNLRQGQTCLPLAPRSFGQPCFGKIANSELLTAGNPTV